MKNLSLLSVKKMVILTIAVCLTACFSSCKKDVDFTKDESLIGDWIRMESYRTFEDGLMQEKFHTYEYDFDSDGTGTYACSKGIYANLVWKTSSANTVHIKFIYNTGYRGSVDYTYRVQDDGKTLRLDGKTYNRRRY